MGAAGAPAAAADGPRRGDRRAAPRAEPRAERRGAARPRARAPARRRRRRRGLGLRAGGRARAASRAAAWTRLAHALARTDRVGECIAACERALELGADGEVRGAAATRCARASPPSCPRRAPRPRRLTDVSARQPRYWRLDVVAQHALRAERRAERAQRRAHPLDPALREAVGVALVEERHDLLAQQPLQLGRVARVLGLLVLERPRRSSAQPFVAVVGLGPPAVEHAQVQAAVDRRLHAARAARLERRPRQVQPHVGALDEQRGAREVVVLEVDDAPGDLRAAA